MATNGISSERLAEIKRLEGLLKQNETDFSGRRDNIVKKLHSGYSSAGNTSQTDDYRSSFEQAENTIELMKKTHDDEMKRLRAEYDELAGKQEQIRRELEQERCKLKNELDELRKNGEAESLSEKIEAEKALENVHEAYSRAEKMPVECFFGDQLSVYGEMIKQISKHISDKMYSAALGVADNCKYSIESLIVKTGLKIDEFENEFELYKSTYRVLYDELKSENSHIMRAPSGKIIFDLNDDALDYWSESEYSELIEMLNEHKRFIDEISRETPARWMKNHKGSSVKLISDRREGLCALSKRFGLCIRYAFDAVACYQQLFRIRKLAINIMEANDFKYHATAFGASKMRDMNSPGFIAYRQFLDKEICTEQGKIPDYRQERRIIFVRWSGRDKEYVYLDLIPTRCERKIDFTTKLIVVTDNVSEELSKELRTALENNMIHCQSASAETSVRENDRQGIVFTASGS